MRAALLTQDRGDREGEGWYTELDRVLGVIQSGKIPEDSEIVANLINWIIGRVWESMRPQVMHIIKWSVETVIVLLGLQISSIDLERQAVGDRYASLEELQQDTEWISLIEKIAQDSSGGTQLMRNISIAITEWNTLHPTKKAYSLRYHTTQVPSNSWTREYGIWSSPHAFIGLFGIEKSQARRTKVSLPAKGTDIYFLTDGEIQEKKGEIGSFLTEHLTLYTRTKKRLQWRLALAAIVRIWNSEHPREQLETKKFTPSEAEELLGIIIPEAYKKTETLKQKRRSGRSEVRTYSEPRIWEKTEPKIPLTSSDLEKTEVKTFLRNSLREYGVVKGRSWGVCVFQALERWVGTQTQFCLPIPLPKKGTHPEYLRTHFYLRNEEEAAQFFGLDTLRSSWRVRAVVRKPLDEIGSSAWRVPRGAWVPQMPEVSLPSSESVQEKKRAFQLARSGINTALESYLRTKTVSWTLDHFKDASFWVLGVRFEEKPQDSNEKIRYIGTVTVRQGDGEIWRVLRHDTMTAFLQAHGWRRGKDGGALTYSSGKYIFTIILPVDTERAGRATSLRVRDTIEHDMEWLKRRLIHELDTYLGWYAQNHSHRVMSPHDVQLGGGIQSGWFNMAHMMSLTWSYKGGVLRGGYQKDPANQEHRALHHALTDTASFWLYSETFATGGFRLDDTWCFTLFQGSQGVATFSPEVHLSNWDSK